MNSTAFMSQLEASVLLVEDSDDDAWVAKRAFMRHHLGDQLAVVRTGEEALDYLREIVSRDGDTRTRPKVVFLDLKLPGINGHEVLRQMRADERLRSVPVVVISSSNLDSDVAEAYRLGANSFVSKQYGQPKPGEYLIDIARYWLTLNQPMR